MPTVNIQGVGTVNFPDSMSAADIQAAIETDILPKQRPNLKAQNPAEYDTDSPEYQAKYGPQAVSTGENLAAGAGKAVMDLAQGAGQYLGITDRADVAATRERDAPLMSTTAGKVGAVAGGVASAVPALMIPGANTVAGAGLVGAAYGALQPSESTKETLTNTAVGGVMGAGGQYVGGKVSGYLSRKLASRAASRAATAQANAGRDATVAAGREAGYVIPPSSVNPSAVNRGIEGLSGKIATQQAAAIKNQAVTDALAKADLGIANDAALNRGTLEVIRKQAGEAYKAVKGAGAIITDGQYLDDLTKLANSVDEVAKDFPDANVGANQDITKLVDSLLRDKFDSSSAVAYLKQLRKAASGNMSGVNAADPSKRALGMAQRQAAEALEDQVIRHLQSSGLGDVAENFDKARTLIAKTYSVEAALKGSSVNAQKLAQQLSKRKPLSGGLATAAKMADEFPAAMAVPKGSPVSALDALVGVGGPLTGNPALMLYPVGRSVARGTVLSQAGQNAMLAPSTGVAGDSVLSLLLSGSKLAPAAAIGVPANINQ